MLDEKIEEKLLKLFDKRFQEYNTEVLKEFGKIIGQFDGLSYSEAYKLGQILKYDKSYKKLLQKLSKISGKSVEDIKKILEKVAKDNLQFAETFYKARKLDVPVYEENKELQMIVKSVYNLTGKEFTNIANTTGFRLLDNDGNPMLLDFKKTYIELIDRSIIGISQGKETFNQVRRNTIKELASSGVRKIEYKSGYSRRLDTSVRQNILDGMRQVANESQVLFGEEFDSDGVEISVHEMPAPDHELVQGKQFSNKEFKKFQNDIDSVSYDGVSFPAEFEGHDRRSISEYNCYHKVFSIVLGVSKPLYSNKELKKIIDDNNKGFEFDGKHYTMYQGTQLQRKIETEIRYAKDEQIMSKESKDKENILLSQKRISDLTIKYKNLCNVSGLNNNLSKRAVVSGYQKISVKRLK